MGQYISTGLIYEFRADRKNVEKLDTDPEVAIRKAANAFVGNPGSFNCELRNDDNFYWNLNSELVTKQMTNFLEKYYTDLYDKASSAYKKYCQPILDHLPSLDSADQYWDWADEEGQYCFCICDSNYSKIKIDHNELGIQFTPIRLSLEGKVLVEDFDLHQAFFQLALRRAYADSPFGGALTVRILG